MKHTCPLIRWFLFAVLAAAPSVALADTPLGPPQVIPYDGVIEFDGIPVNGTVTLRFTLSDMAPGGDVDRGEFIWQSVEEVEIYSGRFSLSLGAGEIPLPDAVFLHTALYLAIDVESAAGEWVELSGAQQIQPAPYSYLSASAEDFDVVGALDVEGESRFADQIVLDGTGERCIRFQDDTDGDTTLCAADSSYPSTGVTIRARRNPDSGNPIFRVLSQGGAERLVVEHEGEVSIVNDLSVSGTVETVGVRGVDAEEPAIEFTSVGIGMREPFQIPRFDTPPFDCDSRDEEGYLYFFREDGFTGLCMCTYTFGGTYNWVIPGSYQRREGASPRYEFEYCPEE